MIVEWIWRQVTQLLGALLDLFPSFSAPAWVTDVGSYAAQGVAFANGLSMWVPLDALRNTFVFLLGVGVAVFAVRTFRILLSLFTGGGGGAA